MNYFRFSTVWHNRLKNKHLTEHLRNSGNGLETVRFLVFCGAMLSNNPITKVVKILEQAKRLTTKSNIS